MTTTNMPGLGTYQGAITNGSMATNTSYKPPLAPILVQERQITAIRYHLLLRGIPYSFARITTAYDAITTTPYTNTTYFTNWANVSQPGIVLSNGAVLPPQGLSIATPDPAYVIGNWNIKTSPTGTSDAGSSYTANSRPSAILADAITDLSSAWNPAQQHTTSRTAKATAIRSMPHSSLDRFHQMAIITVEAWRISAVA